MRILMIALVAGLMTSVASPVSAADSLGRLFMTREQRLSLDAQREPGADALDYATSIDTAPTAPAEDQVLVNGLVQRSRGPDVVWVNGVRTGGASGQVRLERGPDKARRVTLKDTTGGHTIRLKPGQYWERATGRVADCYGCGQAAEAAPGPSAPAEPAAGKP